MQVKELKNKNLLREFEVTLSAGDINKKVEARLASLAKNIKIPGFRPGKVPLKIVKQKHGKDVLAEVLENAVADSSQKVMEERNIYPAMQPKIEVASFDEGKDLVYNLSLEIYPEVPEFEFDKIKLEKYVVEASEEDTEDALKRLQESQKNFVQLKKERAAKKGDAVMIDFEGKIDGVAFAGGAGKGFRLELGSGQFIPGFEDQLVGSKKGDKVVVKVKFPKDYGSAELAGKASEFDVTVHEILQEEKVKIDDELAKKFGMEDLAKLKEEIAKQIVNDFAGLARTNLKKDLFDNLDKNCPFDVPENMVELEFKSLMQTVEKAEGNSKKKKAGKEDKEQEKEFKAISERRVRLGILLADIGRKNNISVTEDELRRAVFEQARNYPGQEQKVIELYQKNRSALEQLKGPILEEKVVDFILGKVKITDKKVSSKELLKISESDE